MSGNSWQKHKERGSPFLIKLIGWLSLHFGRPVGRIILYPITLYFLLFHPKACRASRNFLGRVLDRKPDARDTFRHIHTFASTILDRVFFLTKGLEDFDVILHGETALFEQYHRGKGVMMLGSHLGSFEILRCLATMEDGVTFKALMYQQNSEKISKVLEAINPEISKTIIPVGTSDSMLQIQESFERGEVIGVLGDRVTKEDKRIVQCQFFDQEFDFPAGPVLLAGLLNVPVVMFFGVYLGGKRYAIHFEVLSEGFRFERGRREEQIQQLTQHYASRLEHYSRKYPYNWFNFFDFFGDEVR